MQRNCASQLIAEHKGHLARRFGVTGLVLFGSTARGDAREDSDVNILLSFEGPAASESCFGIQLPRMQPETLLSGRALIATLNICNRQIKDQPEAIGGEMVGAGFHHAACRHQVDWILVKAICDWADDKKIAGSKDRDRRLAANHP
jgi:nucleoside phosphorylase